MAIVFRKSAKGVDEIATRAHRLPPRLRSALILVDGVRTDTEVATLLPQHPAGALQDLHAQGFIEVAATVDDAPRASRPPASPDRAPSERTADRPAQKSGFPGYRAALLRAFNDLTGPTGESLAIRMERAQSRDELEPLLDMACRLIANVRGSEQADEFRTRFASL